jgi:hypothetical protein
MANNKSTVNIILGGASITNSPWPTWADAVRYRYVAKHIDTSKKGLGNEAILLRMLDAAAQVHYPDATTFLLPMLTNIDKWDWYVDQKDRIKKYDKEKHSLARIANTQGGFWSTGSWFPLEKEIYKENFYSQDYFTLRSLQMLAMFKQICHRQGWKYLILFDSPIWSMTEAEVNQGKEILHNHQLINTPLCQWFYQCSGAADNVYEPGMLGFLYENKLPWFSEKWKCHPGPLSQLAFARQHVIPILDLELPHNGDDHGLDYTISRMDKLWTL